VKTLALLVVGAALLTACSSARTTPCANGAPSQALTGYRLGPQDRVRVTVFRQPELSGEFALDGEGSLALPLIGNVPAGGLATRELEDEIERRLQSEGYLVNPQVGVQPLKHRSFYVLGEVRRPGSYEYRNGISVISAVALAGGYTYRANTSHASIERGGCSFPTQADTAVLPGDIVSIAERYF
jgi:polysaccharide export outer membrane protein